MLVRDAMPFMAEQDDRPAHGWLEARQRHGAVSRFDGHDPPTVAALLLDPLALAATDPVRARSSAKA
jgi:hypothetical protein